MNITVAKIKKILERDYAWANVNEYLIKDIIRVLDDELKWQKGISIRKNK